jgi:1-acyl-sn-glycerol-3-phosphate acyltransferase
MWARVRYFLQGTVVLLIVSVSTIVLTTSIFLLAIFKFIAPKGAVRNTISLGLSWLGELWVSVNKVLVSFFRGMEWDVELSDGLDHKSRYLIFCNHQSWVDILVLQHCLNRRVPFMRFLLKQQLIWVPFLGVAWWALDMAFLRRYSRQQLIKNPALRGKDLENAARACEKLKHIPVSMMTFPEGTRFTTVKQVQQKSPFNHLLRPRYGGIGQVLYSFDDALDCLVDVTIIYPNGTPSMWQFVSGQVKKISVRIRLRPIAEGLSGVNFREDGNAKGQLKNWLNDIWLEKDLEIRRALDSGAVGIAGSGNKG